MKSSKSWEESQLSKPSKVAPVEKQDRVDDDDDDHYLKKNLLWHLMSRGIGTVSGFSTTDSSYYK